MLAWLIRLFTCVRDLHERCLLLQDKNVHLTGKVNTLESQVAALQVKVEAEKERMIEYLTVIGRLPPATNTRQWADNKDSVVHKKVTEITQHRDVFMRQAEQLERDQQDAMEKVDAAIPEVLRSWSEQVGAQRRHHLEMLKMGFDEELKEMVTNNATNGNVSA